MASNNFVHTTKLAILHILLLCFIAPFSNAATCDHALLDTCLEAAGIKISTPDNSTWTSDILPWQLRIQPTPAAVVFPTTEEQIAKALKCAQEAFCKVAARNGGHSFASYGVGGNDDALVVDMSAFQSMVFDDATGYLTYGGGSIVGIVETWLWQNHGRHFPHVRGNRVGLAGSSIGSGFGTTTRFLGTPMDNLVAVTYMLANGTIANCSRTENADLFFVAQGAGSSYGILLSLTTRTWKPTYDKVTNYTISLGNVDIDTGVKALLTVQSYALSKDCPDELSLRWTMTAPPWSGSGFYYGDPSTFSSIIAPLMAALPSSATLAFSTIDFWTSELNGTPGLDVVNDVSPPRNFYVQAVVLRTDGPFTYESAYALYSNTTYAFNRTDLRKSGLVDLWGGVSRDIADTDTAYEHANNLWLVRWEGRVNPDGAAFPSDGTKYSKGGMKAFENELKREGVKVRGYVNYRDTELSVEEWSHRLYGRNWKRMLRIKKEVDPLGLFTTNDQSIPAV